MLEPTAVEKFDVSKIEVATFEDFTTETLNYYIKKGLRRTDSFSKFLKGGYMYIYGRTLLVQIAPEDFPEKERDLLDI